MTCEASAREPKLFYGLRTDLCLRRRRHMVFTWDLPPLGGWRGIARPDSHEQCVEQVASDRIVSPASQGGAAFGCAVPAHGASSGRPVAGLVSAPSDFPQCGLPVTSTRPAPDLRFSKLNSRPADAFVCASPGTSRRSAQESRSRCFDARRRFIPTIALPAGHPSDEAPALLDRKQRLAENIHSGLNPQPWRG